MYAVDLFYSYPLHPHRFTAALAATLEAGEAWAARQLRPSGAADRYRVRPAEEAEMDALNRGLFAPSDPPTIYVWWEDALRNRA